MTKRNLTESQFYMWRTLFALAHADGIVTGEEVRFMAEALEDLPFSDEQRGVLNDDIRYAQRPEDMFSGITDVRDQAAFFKYARRLVHIDGDYGTAEQAVMLRLKEMHIKSADVDDLIGKVRMELEEENGPEFVDGAVGADAADRRGLRQVVYSFRDAFLKDRF